MKRKRFTEEQIIRDSGRSGIGDWHFGVVPQARDGEHDVVQVAKEVWRDGNQRRPSAEAT